MQDWREQEALYRYAVIHQAVSVRLSPGERAALVRALAGELHAHPAGELRTLGPRRSTVGSAPYGAGGFEALKPRERALQPHGGRAAQAGG